MIGFSQRFGRFFRLIAAAVVALTLAACAATYEDHGFIPPQQQLDEILIGLDTRDTLKVSIGTPGTTGLLTEGAWYYVESRFRKFGYREAEEIDREVVAISFARDGTVENIERFGLEDGKVIILSRRVTESNVKGVSFLKQLFGNFGRVDVSQLL